MMSERNEERGCVIPSLDMIVCPRTAWPNLTFGHTFSKSLGPDEILSKKIEYIFPYPIQNKAAFYFFTLQEVK